MDLNQNVPIIDFLSSYVAACVLQFYVLDFVTLYFFLSDHQQGPGGERERPPDH